MKWLKLHGAEVVESIWWVSAGIFIIQGLILAIILLWKFALTTW